MSRRSASIRFSEPGRPNNRRKLGKTGINRLGTTGTVDPHRGNADSDADQRDRRRLAMEQLTTKEASCLETEDADRHLSLAIGVLAIANGPIPAGEPHRDAVGTDARRTSVHAGRA